MFHADQNLVHGPDVSCVTDTRATGGLTGPPRGAISLVAWRTGGGRVMAPTRRDVLLLGASATAAALLPAGTAEASNGVWQAIDEFTGGALRLEGGVLLDAPEIFDNGGAVPIRVVAEGARAHRALQRRKPESGRRRFQVREAGATRSHDPHPACREPERVCGGGDGGRHVPPGLPEDCGDGRRLRLRSGRWRNPSRA